MEDDFDIVSDVERTGTPKSIGSVSAKDQVSSPPKELNTIFRMERSKWKNKKSKIEGSKADSSKRRTEKMGLDSEEYHNKLDEELAEHMENEPRVGRITAHNSHDRMDVAKGCLFLRCHRCPSMVRIKFSSGVIPKMSVDLDAEYTNGAVLTVCKTCDDIKEDPRSRGFGWDNELVADCAGRFRGMKMDPGLVEGSNFMRAANLVSGVQVPLITAMGRLHFEDRATILDNARFDDEIASIAGA